MFFNLSQRRIRSTPRQKRKVAFVVSALLLASGSPLAMAASSAPSLTLSLDGTSGVLASFRHFPASSALTITATIGSQSSTTKTTTTATGRSLVAIRPTGSADLSSITVTGKSGNVSKTATLGGKRAAPAPTTTTTTRPPVEEDEPASTNDTDDSDTTTSDTSDKTPTPSTTQSSGGGSGLDSPDKKDIAMQLVSTAENSSLDWKSQYAYIEDIGDGRGYTAGIIGFCTGCGDLQALVEHYTEVKPDNVLAKYLPALKEKGSFDDSHDGLDPNFTSDWKTAASDPAFQKAQDDERDRVYFNPSVEQAKADGLQALGQFIYYDAIVMHGPGDDSVSFGGIRAAALSNAKPPAQGGDEVQYLEAFLDARVAAMKTEEAHEDTTRVDTAQRKFLEAGNLTLETPLSFSVYGESFNIP